MSHFNSCVQLSSRIVNNRALINSLHNIQISDGVITFTQRYDVVGNSYVISLKEGVLTIVENAEEKLRLQSPDAEAAWNLLKSALQIAKDISTQQDSSS